MFHSSIIKGGGMLKIFLFNANLHANDPLKRHNANKKNKNQQKSIVKKYKI